MTKSISFDATISTIRGIRTGIEIPERLRPYLPKGGRYQVTIAVLGTLMA